MKNTKLDVKIVPKTLYSWIYEHGKLKLVQTWNASLYRLAFIVLEGGMHITRIETYLTVLPICEL